MRDSRIDLNDCLGTYKLTVDKSKDSSARLKVHDKPLSIVEQLHLVDGKETIDEGSPFELFIRYNKPVKNVLLNRNTKRLPADKRVQFTYEDNATAVRIRFETAQADDQGQYDTTVKDSSIADKDGLRSDSVTIKIKPLPVLFTSEINVSVKDTENIPEKKEVVLTVNVNQEKGKVKWFLNDQEVKDDANHKIVAKNLQRQLTIKSTSLADSGLYAARTDDDERTVQLKIQGTSIYFSLSLSVDIDSLCR